MMLKLFLLYFIFAVAVIKISGKISDEDVTDNKKLGEPKERKESLRSKKGLLSAEVQEVEVDVDDVMTTSTTKKSKAKGNKTIRSKKNKKNKGKKNSSKDKKSTITSSNNKKEKKENNKKSKNTSSKKNKSTNKSNKLNKLLKSLNGIVEKSMIRQVASVLSVKSGETVLDEIVAIGVVLSNWKRSAEAQDVFRRLLKIRKDAPGALLGYSSALLQDNRREDAIAVLNKLIAISPDLYDAYESRSEILIAMGSKTEAVADLTIIIDKQLTTGYSLLNAYVTRGKIYFEKEMHRGAYYDYKKAYDILPEDRVRERAQLLHGIGKCERLLGLSELAINTQKLAKKLDPELEETELESAISYMEMSRWQEALPHVNKAIEMSPRYKLAYGYRGLMFQNLGRPKEALKDFQKAIDMDPREPSGMVVAAASLHALGRLPETAAMYDRILSLSPGHDCWYNREILYFYFVNLETKVSSFNPDQSIDNTVKEGWSRHLPWTKLFQKGYISELAQQAQKKLKNEIFIPIVMNDVIKELVKVTSPIAKWVQLDHPGFMPNERQHRQFGLCALQMAQALRRHVKLLKEGEEGLLVPDVSASSVNYIGFIPSKKALGYHVFGWRDLLDIAVRWRQLSEPLDRVWWIDRMEIQTGADKLQLSTHLHRGWAKVVRYHSYLPMAMNLTKTLLLGSSSDFSEEKKIAVMNTTDIEKLFHVSGGKSFYVTTFCASLADPDEIREGTQITLRVSTSSEGYDFLINSLVNPERDIGYARDMNFTFISFIQKLGIALDRKNKVTSDAAFDHALEMFYFWVNYAPLSRGTSATGYAMLMACVVAMGEEIRAPVPKGKQLDWEGILRLSPHEFVHEIRQWLSQRGTSSIAKKWLDATPGHDLNDVFNTTRNMMAGIGALE
eukprot:gene7228-14744_t